MTIGYVARRLVEAYGRDAARDKAWMRSEVYVSHAVSVVDTQGRASWVKSAEDRWAFWRSVARACTRVPVPARRGATP